MSAPAPGTWRRRVAIRGDAVAIGVLLVASGAALGVVAALRLVPPPLALAGVVLVVAGAGVVRRARAAWRALLADVVRARAEDDPGPSPVPWIADALWRARNRFDPELDPPAVLVAELDPTVRPYGRDATGAFREPVLRPVTPEERALAPVDPVPAGAAVPEEGDAPSWRARLVATPGRFVAVAPRWPYCCGRPATFETDRTAERSPRALFLPADPGAAGGDDPLVGGSHGFQCRSCGRRYATEPAF